MDSSQQNNYIEFKYATFPKQKVNAVLGVRVSEGVTYSAYIHEQGEFYNERMYMCFTGKVKFVGRLVQVGTTLGWFQLTEQRYKLLVLLLHNVITFTPAKD